MTVRPVLDPTVCPWKVAPGGKLILVSAADV